MYSWVLDSSMFSHTWYCDMVSELQLWTVGHSCSPSRYEPWVTLVLHPASSSTCYWASLPGLLRYAIIELRCLHLRHAVRNPFSALCSQSLVSNLWLTFTIGGSSSTCSLLGRLGSRAVVVRESILVCDFEFLVVSVRRWWWFVNLVLVLVRITVIIVFASIHGSFLLLLVYALRFILVWRSSHPCLLWFWFRKPILCILVHHGLR